VGWLCTIRWVSARSRQLLRRDLLCRRYWSGISSPADLAAARGEEVGQRFLSHSHRRAAGGKRRWRSRVSNESRLPTQRLDNKFMDGLGELHMRVDPEVYFHWCRRGGQRMLERQIILREFKRDNPDVRVLTKSRKTLVTKIMNPPATTQRVLYDVARRAGLYPQGRRRQPRSRESRKRSWAYMDDRLQEAWEMYDFVETTMLEQRAFRAGLGSQSFVTQQVQCLGSLFAAVLPGVKAQTVGGLRSITRSSGKPTRARSRRGISRGGHPGKKPDRDGIRRLEQEPARRREPRSGSSTSFR